MQKKILKDTSVQNNNNNKQWVGEVEFQEGRTETTKPQTDTSSPATTRPHFSQRYITGQSVKTRVKQCVTMREGFPATVPEVRNDENQSQQRKLQKYTKVSQLKSMQRGYVQKLKEKLSIDNYEEATLKFENPVLTLHKRQLKQIKEISEEESVIKDEINVTITNFCDKSIIKGGGSKNRLMEMKNASSHSSSNSQKNLNFQLSGSEKLNQTDNSCHSKRIHQEDEQVSSSGSEGIQFQKEWMRKEWKQGDFLGAGQFGQVFQAMDCKSGQIFALKKIDLKTHFDQKDLELLQNELLLMKRLRHPHIITYMGHEINENEMYIYLEYMSQGSLTSIINHFGPLKEQTIGIYSRQVLEALQYLHSHRVVHRDIKGANILVDTDGIVKVADFGCSSQMEKTMTLFRSDSKDAVGCLKGSIPWMPPEVITQTKYGTSADIWSFGCTVLEMATGTVPWCECDFDNPLAAILKIGLQDEIPLIPESLSDDLIDFIKQCLNRDPLLRPTATQLLSHIFLLCNE